MDELSGDEAKASAVSAFNQFMIGRDRIAALKDCFIKDLSLEDLDSLKSTVGQVYNDKRAEQEPPSEDRDSLLFKTIRAVMSSLGERGRQLLFRELLGAMSEQEKTSLLLEMAFDLNGGMGLSQRYQYGIFSVCNPDFFFDQPGLMGGSVELNNLYYELDKNNFPRKPLSPNSIQIMFITDDGKVRFNCARTANSCIGFSHLPFPTNPWAALVEHPEARLVHAALVDLEKKSEWSKIDRCMVVRFRDDGVFAANGDHLDLVDEDGLLGATDMQTINAFSTAIERSGQCGDFDATSLMYEREFGIEIKGRKCLVLERVFDCETG